MVGVIFKVFKVDSLQRIIRKGGIGVGIRALPGTLIGLIILGRSLVLDGGFISGKIRIRIVSLKQGIVSIILVVGF